MMQEARARERRKKEELKAILAGSRSDSLMFLEEPMIEGIPGLTNALDGFIGEKVDIFEFSLGSEFRMGDYRSHILSFLGMGSRLFSDMPFVKEDSRKDKIWRFVTLIFMRQDGEVSLTQYGADILVERIAE